MADSKNTSVYEVQTLRDNRWVTEATRDDLEHAKTLALKLLDNPHCGGARVMGVVRRLTGQEVEKEFFSRTQHVKAEGPIHIDRVETAPTRCEKIEDYFGLSSRITVYRILRTYMEKLFLIPSEILHNGREMRKLVEKDTLVPSAVDRIATLQTPQGSDPKARKAELYKAIDEISARSRASDDLKLPKITGSFADMVKALPKVANEWERNHLAITALTRDLLEMRSFSAKLERLCTLMMGLEDTALAGMLDGLIAELLQTSVIQDILGWQPGLGHAACAMLDLADGQLAAGKSDLGDITQDLNTLFSQHRLPESRGVLVERTHQQIASPTPLYRSDSTQEQETFRKVLKRLLTLAPNGIHVGLHSGPATAEALTFRALNMVERGGVAGRGDAIKVIYQSFPDHAYGLVYLSDLSRTVFAKECVDVIASTALSATRASHITDLVLPTLTTKERLIRATSAHAAVGDSALAPEVKHQICEFIDKLVDDYMLAEKIIDKLDNTDSNLHDRANRLVQFCAAHVLPEGRSLTHARNRIRDLLRQPNFNDRFVEGVTDPKAAQDALREFHRLLEKAGFHK